MRLCLSPFLLSLALLICSGLPASAKEDWFAELCASLDVDPEQIRSHPRYRAYARQIPIREAWKAERFEELERLLEALPAPADWTPYDESIPSLWPSLFGKDLAKARRWAASRPQSALAAFAVAQACKDLAWKARGTGFAPSVSEEGWRTFRELMPKAYAWVEKALELDSELVWALSLRVHLDRSTSAPRERLLEHYAALKAVAPELYGPHAEVFWALLPRYGGTWKEAWAHVRSYAEERPRDDGPLGLLFQAHKVRVGELFGRHQRSDSARRKRLAYYVREDVAAEFEAAIQRVREACPDSWEPAKVELALAQDRGDEALVQTMEAELARKGAPSAVIAAASATLADPNATETAKHEALGKMLLGISVDQVKAINLAIAVIVGRDYKRPRMPRASYLLWRTLGALGRDEQAALAMVHRREGIGVEADSEAGLAELRAGAEAGSPWCSFFYGGFLLTGDGELEVDEKAGLKWLRAAAEGGCRSAFPVLVGYFVREDRRDLAEAERWVQLAEKRGERRAKDLRRLLEHVKKGGKVRRPGR